MDSIKLNSWTKYTKCFKLVLTWASSPSITTWLSENISSAFTIYFIPKSFYLLKMLVINVGVDSEESLQDQLSNGDKVPREGNSDLAGEESLVINLVLYPGHQVVNILWGRALDWLLDVFPVRPVIFILRPCGHHRAALLGAVVGQGSDQHRDLVEELGGVDGHPLVHVLPVRQHDGLSEVPRAKSGFRVSRKYCGDEDRTIKRSLTYFIRSAWWAPSGTFFLGLKVFDARVLANMKLILTIISAQSDHS